jgi:hypothetical protein
VDLFGTPLGRPALFKLFTVFDTLLLIPYPSG